MDRAHAGGRWPVRASHEIVVRDETLGLDAFLVVAPTDRGVSFGGLRIDPSVTRAMVVGLADTMSLKLAGHGSPVGGAKAGLQASPDDPRLRGMLRRFAEECREVLSTTTILGKDMGVQQWMLDEVYDALGLPQLGVAGRRFHGPGSPARPCDLAGYGQHMTGKGAFWSIEQALGGTVEGARVLIQGFGVVGTGIAWHLDRSGARIVGVSDREKAILRPDGLDLEILMAAKSEGGLLPSDRLPDAWASSACDDLLVEHADVLVLAAGSYLVDDALAARISAPLIVEAANLALTPGALEVLHAKGVRVVPDVVASSSSAALVGHQIASGNRRDPARLWAEIEGNIKRNTDGVHDLSRELDVDPRTAFRCLVQAGSENGGLRHAG